MSAMLLALIFGLPSVTLAAIADCPNANVDITFDVQPRTIAVGEQALFKTSFAWEEGTEAICNGVIVDFEWIDNFQAEEIPVRQRSNITGNSRGPINLDFRESIANAGNHRFYVRASIDGRQITRSGVVQVTATGADVAKQAAPSFAEGPPQAGPVTLEVAIGNLTQAASIAEYIAAVFRYALSIGGIIATVMVVYGGVKWLVAAGDSGKITEAKGVITNAILGLIILLGTYLLLFTINPEIVRLRELKLPKVERAVLTGNWCEDLDLNEVILTPSIGQCGKKGKVEPRNVKAQVTSDKCDFQTCPADEGVCVGFSGAFECKKCEELTDDDLGALRLSENDAGCAPFAPRQRGDEHSYCFFSEDDRLESIDDVCALVQFRCEDIDDCTDYDDQKLVHEGILNSIPLDSELISGVSLAGLERLPPEQLNLATRVKGAHFTEICRGDPCNVGPCQFEIPSAWTRIGMGNFYNCLPL